MICHPCLLVDGVYCARTVMHLACMARKTDPPTEAYCSLAIPVVVPILPSIFAHTSHRASIGMTTAMLDNRAPSSLAFVPFFSASVLTNPATVGTLLATGRMVCVQ